jgi:anti-anti-sigma factor
MEFRFEQLPGNVTRVIPSGRWDVLGAEQIDGPLSILAASGQPVVIDFSEVTYLSSAGIRSLIKSVKAIDARGGKLALASLPSNVEAALSISGVDMLMTICCGLEAAVRAVTG